MIVVILTLTHLAVFVIGWIIGASKSSCPPDREMDEYGSKRTVNAQESILEHFEKKDEGADTPKGDWLKEKYRYSSVFTLENPLTEEQKVKFREFLKDNPNNVLDSETPIIKDLETEMAQYIVLRNGWELRKVGDKEIKIVKDGNVITKQLTSELNKWIANNYEPNGEPKPLQESNEN